MGTKTFLYTNISVEYVSSVNQPCYPYFLDNSLSQIIQHTLFNLILFLLSITQHGKPKGIHFKFKDLLLEINSHSANYTLRMANRLYAEKTYSILPVSYSIIYLSLV